jgi:enediyne biosynthesis protein E7
MTAVIKPPLVLPTPPNVGARRALARLESFTRECAQDHTHTSCHDVSALKLLLATKKSGTPPDMVLRDEFLTLLLAGHDTTAAALTWCWILLAQYPETQERVRHELTEVLGSRPATPADLSRLSYTRMVLEETLRLYPPVWVIPRRAVIDHDIGGEPVRQGTEVLVCVYEIHRHPDFWKLPDVFDPDRFAEGGVLSPMEGAYLPFGEGARACVGRYFGTLEILLTLATMVRRFRVELPHGANIRAEPSLALHAPKGLALRLHRCKAIS